MAGERVLRYLPSYGVKGGTKSQEKADAERATLSLVQRVFKAEGFQIVPGDKEDRGNPNAVGVGIFTAPVEFILRRNRYIEHETTVTMPLEYQTIESILNATEPIMAKRKDAHRGEQKYLLHTQEDRERFVAVAFLPSNTLLRILQSPPTDRQLIFYDLLEVVKKRKLNPKTFADTFKDENMEQFDVEKYIETPSDRYTSFRVLAGADGEAQYMLLVYSNAKKSDQKSAPPSTETLRGYDRIFLDEDNPCYIPPVKVVSMDEGSSKINITQLLANPEMVANLPQHEKDILITHGFDLADFKLPQPLQGLGKQAGEVGVFMRFVFPYMGEDFMLGTDGVLYFTEANMNATVRGNHLGLDEVQYPPEEAKAFVLRRIAQRLK